MLLTYTMVLKEFGYCGHKCRHGDQDAARARSDVTPQVSQLNPMVLYEQILPESNPKTTNQFELKDSVAYNLLNK